jgi:sialate O-acetylesterase
MQIGAIIEKGPKDWQIVQQIDGRASIEVSGSWSHADPLTGARVFVRIVKEETGEAVIPWMFSEDLGECKWRAIVNNIPAGGLYRIETCLCPGDNKAMEWSIRGDMVHHFGVGDLFVIAGQSNSAGYGKDPVFDPPELGIHILKNSGRWDLASHPMNESTGTLHEINRETANPGHSPYLSFARQLKRELGYPIGLIQTSLGGSPLRRWNPDEEGDLYRNMMEIIGTQAGKVSGILWYQGCSDANADECNTYLERFSNMVSHLRRDLNEEALPVLTVQLNRYTAAPQDDDSDKAWGILREVQRQAAKQMQNVFIIPSLDSSLSDAIHNSSASNMVLGERLARTALARLYGKRYLCGAPEIGEVKKEGPNKIVLAFDHVTDRMYTFEIGADKLPFAVMDEEGRVGIASYEIDRNKMILTLERKIQGICHVHGAYERNPGFVIPIDAGTYLPMLAFYGVEVL